VSNDDDSRIELGIATNQY